MSCLVVVVFKVFAKMFLMVVLFCLLVAGVAKWGRGAAAHGARDAAAVAGNPAGGPRRGAARPPQPDGVSFGETWPRPALRTAQLARTTRRGPPLQPGVRYLPTCLPTYHSLYHYFTTNEK